ncbi:hypothetical protein EZS27_024235 [termite gut metagenome]|uniref:Glycosyl transferase n=1 Tax=termite gut metagenome TaxID=433724 RepID=A0A5J4QYD6_9ZZZZ
MIPKVIHYCWFGRSPLPQLALKCIESWRRFFPDYEIKEWNEDNFDVNIITYTKEAYQVKKYAFVSDYARFWILYNYGGIYFDTDVEVIKPMNDILEKGAFMGCECDGDNTVNPGLGIACAPGLGIYKELLDLYANLHIIEENKKLNLTTIVKYTTNVLYKHGLKNGNMIQFIAGIYIYPKEYFCPKSYGAGKMDVTDNTYCIHHFAGSWLPYKGRIKRKIQYMIGERWNDRIRRMKGLLRKYHNEKIS